MENQKLNLWVISQEVFLYTFWWKFFQLWHLSRRGSFCTKTATKSQIGPSFLAIDLSFSLFLFRDCHPRKKIPPSRYRILRSDLFGETRSRCRDRKETRITVEKDVWGRGNLRFKRLTRGICARFHDRLSRIRLLHHLHAIKILLITYCRAVSWQRGS